MKKPNFLLAKLKLTKKKKEKKEKIDANNIAKWPDKELKNPFYNKNKTEDKNEKNKVVNSQVNTDKQASGFKAVSGFILVLLILILPFKVLSYYNVFNLNILEKKLNLYSQSAMESLMLASDKAKTLEMNDASNYFSLAEDDFLAAQAEVENIDKFIFNLAALAKNPKYKMASQTPFFLEAGLQISKTGEELGLALDSFLKNKDNKNVNLVASLENFIAHGKKATISAQSLNETINKIDFSLLPTKYQAEFLEIKDTSKVLSEGLKESVILAETLKSFMGIESDKRYLFIFQNNSELRASGGFMGSYALIDISRGKIKNLEVPKGGTYDTEAGLTLNIESPEPLWLVSPRWYFWDANWWPDWKKSAENISWFYEKSAGPTVDGVISFTPRVIEDLLEILGPIDMMQEYGVIITSENFWETVQSIVEEKTVLKTTEEGKIVEEKNTEPKKIIGDMMNKLINELPERLTTEKLIKMMSSIENNLQEKHILFYFSDDKMQAQAEKNSWAGRIKDTQYDYLLVVNTNIAGQKTDRAIKQDIVHYSQVQDDGSIVNTVKIVRTHQGVKRQEFTGVRNVNWMRVYVPKGSTFISASGFEAPNNKYFSYPSDQAKKLDSLEAERQALIDQVTNTKIYQESNKTVFANWTMVDPGESVEIILKYKLPFNFNSIEPKYNWLDNIKHKILGKDPNLVPYSLLVQKQPGSINNTLVSHLNIKSADYKALWSSENINSLQNNSWNFNSNLKTDKYFGALWQQINTDK
jgi:CRISPR/Cas system CMR subunit Cmr4 (Cas7 group RAMP superfamily)